jgi:polysaccharide export outer membrane protein
MARGVVEGAGNAMTLILGKHSLARLGLLASWGRRLLTLIMLNAWATGPAAAQTPTPQQYRISAGDKIGVTVFGQSDLSGEATVDQNGNLRLPVIGDLPAANLTPSELEKSIGRLLEQGYVRRPVVSVKIAEFRPIYVLGMVRTPGNYPYREGESVLAAIARAGGIGAAEQNGMSADLFQTEERVRLLEISRAALLTKRARLVGQQNGDDRIDFPDLSKLAIDPARLTQIRDGEQRAFMAERQAEQQEIEALEKQFPRLQAEIASLKQQEGLELRQRELNQQLIADYEQLAKSGLARKPTYIEVKREEARIEGNIERIRAETLRSELSIGDLRFRIAELHNNYQRRVMTELRETDRSLLELTVTLPSAQRARAARARQIGWMSAEQGQQPPLVVIRGKGTATVRYDATIDFVLQPGDIVQVGSLLPSALELSSDVVDLPRERTAESSTPLRMGDTAASRDAAAGPARTLK